MRQKSFLQKLRAISLRLTSKRYSGMMLFLLTAPTAERLREACEHLRYWPYVKAFKPVDATHMNEHLRYWPYVKAFKPVDATHMNVMVFIGKGITDERWDYYVTRSCELMNQCIRQYQAYFVVTSSRHLLWLHRYHSNGFLRPNDLLKPFCDFIDKM